jgi:hypothetical protein
MFVHFKNKTYMEAYRVIFRHSDRKVIFRHSNGADCVVDASDVDEVNELTPDEMSIHRRSSNEHSLAWEEYKDVETASVPDLVGYENMDYTDSTPSKAETRIEERLIQIEDELRPLHVLFDAQGVTSVGDTITELTNERALLQEKLKELKNETTLDAHLTAQEPDSPYKK